MKRKRSEGGDTGDAVDALEQCVAHEGPETKLAALRSVKVRMSAAQGGAE
jgi:hypothetical protein